MHMVSTRWIDNSTFLFLRKHTHKDSTSSENNIPGTRTPGSIVAVFSEELSSWGGPFYISQQQNSLTQDVMGPSVPVPPPIPPAIQPPALIPVATQVANLQPKFQRAPEDSGLNPSSFRKRAPKTGLAMSDTQTLACKYYLLTTMIQFTDFCWPGDAPALQISTHDDIAMSAIQKSLAILSGNSLATKLPSISPIAGLLLRALTMRDVRVTHISSDKCADKCASRK